MDTVVPGDMANKSNQFEAIFFFFFFFFFFFASISASKKSLDETCSGSDGEEKPNKCLSLGIEKLPKGVTVGSALQSWMGDGFPVHGDVYHAINGLRKLGRNKRALELMEWVIRERPYCPGDIKMHLSATADYNNI